MSTAISNLIAALAPAVDWAESFNPADDPVVCIELTRDEYRAITDAIKLAELGQGEPEPDESRRPVVVASWCAEDVIARRPEMTVNEAVDFLEGIEDELQIAMIDAGDSCINEALRDQDRCRSCGKLTDGPADVCARCE